jgi:hypothetical protein
VNFTPRLPGVYVRSTARPAPVGLPPLDVAGFVGFAERGELDKPVVVEDPAQFRETFGGDLALARYSDGTILYAQLPAAVDAFFAQGGRRCWVVRVPVPEPGLDFEVRAFLDNYLVPNPRVQSSVAELAAAADDRHDLQNQPLRGLHALFPVEEVALLALPDAAFPPWELAAPPAPEPVISPPLPVPPPAPVGFVDCETAFPSPTTVLTSPPTLTSPLTLTSPPQPTASSENLPSIIEPLDETELRERLLILHQAMLDFCRARGDVVAVLGLPRHYRVAQCREWRSDLRQRLAPGGDFDAGGLSFAAVYHPWLWIGGSESLRVASPEGTACGLIAARERERGVWIAPANRPLAGVVGLVTDFSEDDWATLFQRQFNLPRPQPRDFRVLGAHTLSVERALLQLSTRRLLILLRKLCLQRGLDYVFENNHERFREGVRASLEAVLRGLFDRGAFAGASPVESFQVVTDASVNPPQSVDQGRFVTQILVAPSEPLEFIVVRLIRAGDGLLATAEG